MTSKPRKRQLNVQHLWIEIKNGMTHEEIMTKYNLAEKSLKDFYHDVLIAIAHGKSHIEVDD